MTVAVVLVAYAACVGMLGPRVLGRAGWTGRAPLLAIVTYLAAGWSVVAAVGLAGLTLAVHATALGGGLSQLIGACVHRLRATYGTPGGRRCGTRRPRGWSGIPSRPWGPYWWSIPSRPPTAWPAGSPR